MGKFTAIEWCHHTFNIWRGCWKISAGCAHCYAEAMSGRNPAVLGEWGKDAARPVAADAYWLQALRWYKAAIEAGELRRVFVGSLMDVGEDRRDLEPWRDRLMALIAMTPLQRNPETGKRIGLHWLLLTKRPAALRCYLDEPTLYERVIDAVGWWRDRRASDLPRPPFMNLAPAHRAEWWPQLAIGVSVENQAAADERIPELLQLDVATRFLSCEPLLGPVNVTPWLGQLGESGAWTGFGHRVDWIIVGGESGPEARPMHDEWARSLRDQAHAAGVAFLFKQWGEWIPEGQMDHLPDVGRHSGHVWLDRYDPLHEDDEPDGYSAFRVGKKAAGRLLDGRTWDEVPTP